MCASVFVCAVLHQQGMHPVQLGNLCHKHYTKVEHTHIYCTTLTSSSLRGCSRGVNKKFSTSNENGGFQSYHGRRGECVCVFHILMTRRYKFEFKINIRTYCTLYTTHTLNTIIHQASSAINVSAGKHTAHSPPTHTHTPHTHTHTPHTPAPNT